MDYTFEVQEFIVGLEGVVLTNARHGTLPTFDQAEKELPRLGFFLRGEYLSVVENCKVHVWTRQRPGLEFDIATLKIPQTGVGLILPGGQA